ncbi:MAG: hypothetical protein U0W40_12515 [Acidimicrobiia bacterium]
MTDYRNEEEALRRALDDAAPRLPVTDAPVPVGLTDTRVPRRRRTATVLVAAAVVLALVVVALGVALTRDDDGDPVEVEVDHTQQLLGALAATVNSGGYDVESTLTADPGNRPASNGCVKVAIPEGSKTVCMSSGVGQQFQATSKGTVNISPYAMTAVSQTTIGPITLFVNGSRVWQLGGAGYGTGGDVADASPGASLSGFASLVEGTLGPGQGAVTMMSLANDTGYLGLEATAVERAVADGDGTLADGTHVTYYEVTVDVTKLADGEGLTDEQRQATSDAVAVLQSAGYTGTDERVGVDDAGFIREVTATTSFADGGSLTRHTLLSNFGCAARISMPNEPAVEETAGPCPPVPASTTTTAPESTTSTTSPTTTTEPATTIEPTTLPPTTERPTVITGVVNPTTTTVP